MEQRRCKQPHIKPHQSVPGRCSSDAPHDYDTSTLRGGVSLSLPKRCSARSHGHEITSQTSQNAAFLFIRCGYLPPRGLMGREMAPPSETSVRSVTLRARRATDLKKLDEDTLTQGCRPVSVLYSRQDLESNPRGPSDGPLERIAPAERPRGQRLTTQFDCH